MRTLLLLLMVLIAAPSAFAGDRLIEIQSRVTGALNGILPKSDYMVIINRIDALDSAGGVVNGVVRQLPGLRVGVDEEGQVVLKEGQSAAYSGPVSVTVVIDAEVRGETYRAIESLMPEIMGGSRAGDEVKLKRAVLRQPAADDEPQVVINNIPAPADPNANKGSSADMIKVGALFFLGLGALLWMLSRRTNAQPEAPKRSADRPRYDAAPKEEPKNPNWDPKTFESFDPEILGLYLLKCLNDKDIARARSFFAEATPICQKNTLSAMPSWLASYCLDHLEPKDENEAPLRRFSPELMLRELTVMERAMKDDPTAKATALIQWIPAEAMAKVHPESLAAPSDETRYAILSLRPDLARAFNYDENDALVSGMIFNKKAMMTAAVEMSAWKTRLVVARSAKTSVIEAMANVINRCETFEEVDAKLAGIQKKMSKMDWEGLQPRIASRVTFATMTIEQKKEFLRACNASDFYFTNSVLSFASDWKLDTLLRPKRLASFRAAEKTITFDGWTSEQKRESNKRVLNHLRVICLGEQSVLPIVTPEAA